MATQIKRTANEVATLFVEQAAREIKAYLGRMQQIGDRHFLGAVYDTCALGGINTELSARQACWLTSLMQREGDTQEHQVIASGRVVGTWLYRTWADKRNHTRYRIIYILDPDFAALQLEIDAATVQRVIAFGRRERA
jgi:hypothetical protein